MSEIKDTGWERGDGEARRSIHADGQSYRLTVFGDDASGWLGDIVIPTGGHLEIGVGRTKQRESSESAARALAEAMLRSGLAGALRALGTDVDALTAERDALAQRVAGLTAVLQAIADDDILNAHDAATAAIREHDTATLDWYIARARKEGAAQERERTQAVFSEHGCDACPLAGVHSWNHQESACNASRREIPWEHIRDSTSPDWCPLRKGPVLVQLRTATETTESGA